VTPAERVGAALSGARTDRRPFALTLSLYGSRLLGRGASGYYSDPAVYASGQRSVVDLCGPDIVFGPFAFALEAEAFGAVAERPPRSPPTVRRPAYGSPEDAEAVAPPDVEADPRLRYLVESVRAVAEDQRGRRPVAAPIVAPCDLPVLLLGMEAWIETILFEPRLAEAWWRVAAGHFAALGSAYFAAGASVLVMPVMLANPAILQPEMAERLVLPQLSEALSRLPGPVIFHHGGNRVAPQAGRFASLPNVGGLLVDERDSLAAVRRAVGPSVPILGNISGPHFSSRTAEDLSSRAERLINDREDDPRFILASSGADVPYETDPRTLVSVRRAMEELG